MSNPVARVNVGEILSSSDKDIQSSHRKIADLLSLMEEATIRWSRSVRGNWPESTSYFSLPMASRLRLEFAEVYSKASALGAQHVAVERGNNQVRSNPYGKARVRAILSADNAVKNLEEDLKQTWLRNTNGRSSNALIDYQTKLVFARYGGWVPPKSP